MSRRRNGDAGGAKGAREATGAAPAAVGRGKGRWSARRKMTVVLELLRGTILAVGRLWSEPTPCAETGRLSMVRFICARNQGRYRNSICLNMGFEAHILSARSNC